MDEEYLSSVLGLDIDGLFKFIGFGLIIFRLLNEIDWINNSKNPINKNIFLKFDNELEKNMINNETNVLWIQM